MSDKERECTEYNIDKMLENDILMAMKGEIKSLNHYGVSSNFERNKFDNVYKRNKFKEASFDGKKTQTDYITEQKLHLDKEAAIKIYGKDKYVNHTADVDHIVPEKTAYDKLKQNPFLTDTDVRNIINDESNYRVTQSHHNRHKQDKSNLELIGDSEYSLEEKTRLTGDHIKASTAMNINATQKTLENIADIAAETTLITLEQAAIPMAIEGVHNLILVANGEKEFDEAAVDMARLAGTIVVDGSVMNIAEIGITNIMKNGTNELLKNVANSNAVTQIVFIAGVVGNSVIRFVNGDITGEQFFDEIGQQGVELVSGTIGALAGQLLIPIPVVGAMIGSMVISGACGIVYKGITTMNEYKTKQKEVSDFAQAALSEINRQNAFVKEMIDAQSVEWDKSFAEGFDLIYRGAVNFDADTIAEGLDGILNVFGESVRFKTQEEFSEHFHNKDFIFEF
jgi:hypothetical protein